MVCHCLSWGSDRWCSRLLCWPLYRSCTQVTLVVSETTLCILTTSHVCVTCIHNSWLSNIRVNLDKLIGFTRSNPLDFQKLYILLSYICADVMKPQYRNKSERKKWKHNTATNLKGKKFSSFCKLNENSWKAVKIRVDDSGLLM